MTAVAFPPPRPASTAPSPSITGPVDTNQPRIEVDVTTPPELKRAIMATQPFMPDLERKEFTERKGLHRLYLDLLELDYLKLQNLLDKHSDTEPAAQYKLRQSLAAVFNLVPTVLNLIKLYLFSEDPAIDVKENPVLSDFMEDCDGNGTAWTDFVKDSILPMAMLFGYVDVLIQNPLVTHNPMSEADASAEGIKPRVHLVLPSQRINWSCQSNDAYNWICFQDRASEDAHPLRRNVKQLQAFITLSAANSQFAVNPDSKANTGCWIRSWQPSTVSSTGTPPAVVAANPAGAVGSAQWIHEADWTPTARVPLASLYYQKSNDPDARHDGVSKIATIAVLTRLIIQVMSWTTEDVLANLAILAMPAPGGRPPKDETGKIIQPVIGAFTQIWYSDQAKNPPSVIQGSKEHIDVKLKFIELCIREILRQAHLIGASGEAEKVTSGVQGTVMRTELIQEVKTMAERLDGFTYEVMALAMSWAKNEDWSRARLLKEVQPKVDWFKGPYMMEPAEDVIKRCVAAIEIFRDVSPTLCESMLSETARALMASDDEDLTKALEEVAKNTGALLQDQREMEDLAAGAAAAAGKQSGTVTIRETDTGGATPGGDTAPAPATGAAAAGANKPKPVKKRKPA